MKKGPIIGIIIILAIILGFYLYPSGDEPGPTPPRENCAQEGEEMSDVFEEYPSECCEGLSVWWIGLNTGISVADECYETLLVSGNPVGICTDCGNEICEDIETVCGCPEDCSGKGKSHFNTVAEFCSAGHEQYCSDESTEGIDLCNLCSAT